MTETDVIDGAATEVDEVEVEEIPEATPASPVGIVKREPSTPPSRQVLMPLDAGQVVDGMKAYQELLPQLLDEADYQAAEAGKRFVKKSGWRKIARAFNLSVEIVSISVERDASGKPTRAECVARATAPNGQVQDGDGYCSSDEFTGRRADSVKIENDLRTTATTRAKNRAISDLVGMGEVSAEEIDAKGQAPQLERATADEVAAAKRIVGKLAGTGDRALAIWTEALSHSHEVCPKALAVCLIRLDEDPA